MVSNIARVWSRRQYCKRQWSLCTQAFHELATFHELVTFHEVAIMTLTHPQQKKLHRDTMGRRYCQLGKTLDTLSLTPKYCYLLDVIFN